MKNYENADEILPVDSVRLYGRLKITTLRKTTRFRYAYRLKDGITDRYIFTADNGYEIKLDYRYGTAFLQFELGDLVYGHNYQLLTLGQADATIRQFSLDTGLHLHNFDVSRLDITRDITCKLSNVKYLTLPKYFKERKLRDNGDLLMMTKPKTKNGQADRSVCIYQKDEKVRVETRIMNTGTIKRTFLLDKPLKMADLLTGDFVKAANNYLDEMVHQMTAKNSDHPQVKAFKNAALQ